MPDPAPRPAPRRGAGLAGAVAGAGAAVGPGAALPLSVRAYEHPLVASMAGDVLHPGGLGMTEALADFAGIREGMRVLDAGCGRGASALWLAARRGCEVVGLDASPKSIEAAQARAERHAPEAAAAGKVRFACAGAVPLPFEAGSFDAVWCECAMCLFGDRAAFLAEARRVLRPGGVLAVSDVTLTAPRPSFATAAGMAACLGGAAPLPALEEAARSAGFDEVRVQDRSGEVRELWERVAVKVDLHRVARDFGPMLRLWGVEDAPTLVRDVEDAVRAGDLGYALLAARAPR